jgi:hypothetical protein
VVDYVCMVTLSRCKGKQSLYRPEQALRVQEADVPRFLDNRHLKVVRLSALCTGCLYPLEMVLICVRG